MNKKRQCKRGEQTNANTHWKTKRKNKKKTGTKKKLNGTIGNLIRIIQMTIICIGQEVRKIATHFAYNTMEKNHGEQGFKNFINGNNGKLQGITVTATNTLWAQFTNFRAQYTTETKEVYEAKCKKMYKAICNMYKESDATHFAAIRKMKKENEATYFAEFTGIEKNKNVGHINATHFAGKTIHIASQVKTNKRNPRKKEPG